MPSQISPPATAPPSVVAAGLRRDSSHCVQYQSPRLAAITTTRASATATETPRIGVICVIVIVPIIPPRPRRQDITPCHVHHQCLALLPHDASNPHQAPTAA